MGSIAKRIGGKVGRQVAVPLWTLLNQTPQHYYVNEAAARVAVRNTTFAGTVRMVGAGQTYATITAAITAAASGDIIQLIDGTYDMKNEASGYLLWNAITKNLLLRGNVADPTAVTLTQTGASSFCVRLYRTLDVRIESLTIAQTKDNVCVYSDWNTASIYHAFKNVRFTNTSTDSAAGIYLLGDTNYHAAVSRIEFEGCMFTKATAANLFQFTKLGANVQLLWKSCTWATSNCLDIALPATHTCKAAAYDCTVTQSTDHIVFQFGNDSTAPATTLGLIDLRNNTVNYAAGHWQHGILLGRGTTTLYAVNNRVTMPAGTATTGIGMVIKTVSADVANAIVAGNICTGVRPILIKGGTKITVKYNTAVSTYSGASELSALEGANTNEGDGVLVVDDCVVQNNNLFGKVVALSASTGVIDPLSKASMQTWVVDYNTYFSTDGDWAYDGAMHQLATKDSFWTGSATNDDNSKMVDSAAYEISSETKDV